MVVKRSHVAVITVGVSISSAIVACSDTQATGGSIEREVALRCNEYCRARSGCGEVTYSGCVANCLAVESFGGGCAQIFEAAAFCRREAPSCESARENCGEVEAKRDRCVEGKDGGGDDDGAALDASDGGGDDDAAVDTPDSAPNDANEGG